MGEIILLRLRMNPFRTKLKLNYQIDWGEEDKCDKATYPTRDKQKLHVFDLKTYVDKKREAKREESMNKLLSQVMPNMKQNSSLPGMSTSSKPMSMQDMLKNIDKAVEKLEKEEQKKQASIMGRGNSVGRIEPVKMPSNMVNDSSINPLQASNLVSKLNTQNVVDAKIENKNEKPHVNSTEFASMITNKVNQSVKEDKTVHNDIKPEIKSGNKDYVTDDQFFDDFFADDDD